MTDAVGYCVAARVMAITDALPALYAARQIADPFNALNAGCKNTTLPRRQELSYFLSVRDPCREPCGMLCG
jgi:hypothetical protein